LEAAFDPPAVSWIVGLPRVLGCMGVADQYVYRDSPPGPVASQHYCQINPLLNGVLGPSFHPIQRTNRRLLDSRLGDRPAVMERCQEACFGS
jgi:hypothetical protein